jgi:hypothetical protein
MTKTVDENLLNAFQCKCEKLDTFLKKNLQRKELLRCILTT